MRRSVEDPRPVRDAPAWRRLAERTHVAETEQCPGSARDRRSVPPNRRLPTVPRRRYYSLSKFSRSSQPASPAGGGRAWPSRESSMARKDPRPEVNRRKFLAGVAVAGAATAVTPPVANGATPATLPNAEPPRRPSALPPNMHVAAAETATPKELPRDRRRRRLRLHGRRHQVARHRILLLESGLELPRHARVADQLRRATRCRSSSPARTKNRRSAMAHGYFKVAGKPLMALCHGTVGLQHAAMAIYNAWCDRVPVIVIGGNDLDAAHRPPGVPTVPLRAGHQRAGARLHQVGRHSRSSLQHFAQSFVRAYKIAMTPPYGPVMISLDAGTAAGADHEQRREALHSELRADLAAAGRLRRACEEAAQAAGQCAEPGDRRRSLRRAPQDGVQLAGRSSPSSLQAPVVDQRRPHELPEDPLSQPSRPRRSAMPTSSSASSSPTSGPP